MYYSRHFSLSLISFSQFWVKSSAIYDYPYSFLDLYFFFVLIKYWMTGIFNFNNMKKCLKKFWIQLFSCSAIPFSVIFSTIVHKLSVGLWSGEFSGHLYILIWLDSNKVFISFDVWRVTKSCWKFHFCREFPFALYSSEYYLMTFITR